MIPTPLRHRTACWVVRDVGPGRPRWDGARRAGVRLRQAEGLLLLPDTGPVEVYGRAPEPLGLDVLEDGTGQWAGLLTDDEARTAVALTDVHGFGHLFTYAHPRGRKQDVYLGTTLDALVDRLRADGVRLEVNWPFALTTLASAHILTRSHWSEETFVSGIRLLRPTELLVMDVDGWELHERPVTTDPQGRSYEELLDAGIDRATRLIRSVADAGWPDLRLYSSGGKDSRAVYGLLQHAGVLPHVSVSAADPVRWADAQGRSVIWRDLAVTDSLRRHFDLSWTVEPDYQDRMLSWAESLELHQSYAAGNSWSFPAARQLRWPVEPHVAIRGAGGETVRSGHRAIIAPRAWVRAMGRKRATLGQDLATLHTMIVHPEAHLPPPVVAAGQDLVARSFAPLPSAAINEQLNYHYLLHRNRSHFGHMLQSLDARALPLYPLATPELLRAAYLLPYWERHRGTAVFDLVERVAPELNRMPFAETSWPTEVWAQRDPDFRPPPGPTGPFTREQFPDYFAQEDQNHARRGRWSGPHRFEVRGQTHRATVEGLWRLHDLAGDPAVLPERTVADLARLTGLGRLSAPVTVAKVASLLRVLDSPAAPQPLAAEVRIGRRGVLRRWMGRGGPSEPVLTGRPGGVRTQTELLASSPGAGLEPWAADPATPLGPACHAWVDGSRVLAQRVGRLADGAPLRQTFTLVQGADHLHEVQTDDLQAQVGCGLEPGTYRVLLTARRIDRPEVAYRLMSLPVRVVERSPT
ncbi:hypothetical protein [Ornithinimicrobium pratense]|uniref:Asparagine synthetase domain-containing protein n=1 Tax=Ornithinimicrobium pratense TaxID=2593973 RepID=A0A5J6V561_9MICO|nr:hypothetical protein [Ornithinimicrobium pratense]QFG68153.1 hypothetical protein FY030_04970 [Ornithinimicrobium pratense]